MMKDSIFHSNFGRLLTRSTSVLAADCRDYCKRIREIDETITFADAYDRQCARNERADYAKRVADLTREINARLQMPAASLEIIRSHEVRDRVAGSWRAAA